MIGEASKNIFNHWLVSVKFCNVMADVLLRRKAEHFHFGAVSPQDHSVRTGPMQAHAGVFHEISKLLFGAAQRLLRFLSFGDIHQHVDRTDNLAGWIKQRRRERHEGHARPVGPLGHGLLSASDQVGRFSLIATAIGHSPCGSARPVGPDTAATNRTTRSLPSVGTAAPQGSGGLIEERDAPGGVGRVHAGRQRVQQLVEPPLARQRRVPDGTAAPTARNRP